MYFFWILVSLFLLAESNSYNDFIARCIQKNFDGECDMKCYNFTGKPNEFELLDCKYTPMKKYENVLIKFSVYPPNATGYRENFEMIARELLSTRVDLKTTDEEFEAFVEDYTKNADDHSNKRKWNIPLTFTVFIRDDCTSCPQSYDDILAVLQEFIQKPIVQQLDEPSMSPFAGIVIGLGVSLLLLLAAVGVVGTQRKRKADEEEALFVSGKRRMVYQSGVWVPPFVDNIQSVKFGKIGRANGLTERNRNISQYNSILYKERPIDAPHRTSTPIYTLPAKIPPPPTRQPPPINQGTLPRNRDKSAYYQPVQTFLTLLELVSLNKAEDELVQLIEARVNTCPHELEYRESIDGSTPLILAVKSGKRKVVGKLLELGANIHAKTQPMRSTVLHQAVHNEDLPLLKLFLSKYKERFLEEHDRRRVIDSLDSEDRTPLMLCAFSHRWGADLAKILIEAGAKLSDDGDLTNTTGNSCPKERTVLHHAAMQNNPRLLEYLLDEVIEQNPGTTQGRHIDKLDFEYHTPLWYAVNNGNYECTRLLLEGGAEQHPASVEEKDWPITLAKEMGLNDILYLLAEAKEKKQVDGATRIRKGRGGRKGKRRSSGASSVMTDDSGVGQSPKDANIDSIGDRSTEFLDTVPMPSPPQQVIEASLESGVLYEQMGASSHFSLTYYQDYSQYGSIV